MSRAQHSGPSINDAPSGSALSSTAVVYPEISAQQQRRDDAAADFQQRRITRRLEELERTNPTDIPASSFAQNAPTAPSVPGVPAGMLVTQLAKKKQTPNVRKILYAKKNLRDWLEELPASPAPPYTLATSDPPPAGKTRKICASCGYIGAYKCGRCAEWSCDMTCLKVHARDGGCGVGM